MPHRICEAFFMWNYVIRKIEMYASFWDFRIEIRLSKAKDYTQMTGKNPYSPLPY